MGGYIPYLGILLFLLLGIFPPIKINIIGVLFTKNTFFGKTAKVLVKLIPFTAKRSIYTHDE